MMKNETKLICKGCGANFSMIGAGIPINMMAGRLVIECPACRYLQRIGIDAEGNVYEIKKEDPQRQ